jgi:hypothetical protein
MKKLKVHKYIFNTYELENRKNKKFIFVQSILDSCDIAWILMTLLKLILNMWFLNIVVTSQWTYSY